MIVSAACPIIGLTASGTVTFSLEAAEPDSREVRGQSRGERAEGTGIISSAWHGISAR